MRVRTIAFPTSDGIKLEGRLSIPSRPRGVAVICHGHSPAGGVMPNMLMPAVQRALAEAGWASLRFNYRGIGRSHGTLDSSIGELLDVDGAVAFATSILPGIRGAVVGWSSGVFAGLGAATRSPHVDAFVALAPPVSSAEAPDPPAPDILGGWAARRLSVAGTEDPSCSTEDLWRYADAVGAQVEIIQGADHTFSGHLEELASLVTWFLR